MVRTSRVGRKPVVVPAGVEVKLEKNQISAKGPKGNYSIPVHPYVKVAFDNNLISIKPDTESKHIITGTSKKLFNSIAGTLRANIYNLIHGVSQGFAIKLLLVGVGYRAQAKGNVLGLSLGFSHPTNFEIPAGITIETPTPTEVIIKGINKEQVGLVAANIRKIRVPEPYKGKGIRYSDEVIELKETKKK